MDEKNELSTAVDAPKTAENAFPASPLPEEAEEAEKAPGGPKNQWVELLEMIKFEHTLFALPFAFLGAMTAVPFWPGWAKLGWILLAMVGARTAAMLFNRLIDEDIDKANPRTSQRALPAGRVKRDSAILLMGASITAFGFAAGMLGPLPWKLSPLAMLAVLGYSLCKRFTSLSHLALGLALSIAPVGAWIAVAGRIDEPVLSLAAGVLFWTAGFDILYALQDQSFDKARGLYSLPVRFGNRGAVRISRLFHALALFFWADFNLKIGVSLFPWLSWLAVATILVREQWLVRDGDTDRMDHVFFTLNSMVGVVFFLGHLVEYLMTLGWA